MHAKKSLRCYASVPRSSLELADQSHTVHAQLREREVDLPMTLVSKWAVMSVPCMHVGQQGPAGGPQISPQMMDQMQKHLSDPATADMITAFTQSMKPEDLAGMLKSSGMDVTPEQVRPYDELLVMCCLSQLLNVCRRAGRAVTCSSVMQSCRMRCYALAESDVSSASAGPAAWNALGSRHWSLPRGS